jgi:hypothetical protein
MDDLAKRFQHLSLPSRNDHVERVSEQELANSLSELEQCRHKQPKERSILMYRRLRELATASNIMSTVTVNLYESSLLFSLENGDFEGFTLAAIRLVNELYFALHSENKQRVIALLLLYYALDASREADFSSIFYRLSEQDRSSDAVQYSLSVFLALRRCDYARWDSLVEQADTHQAIILEVKHVD